MSFQVYTLLWEQIIPRNIWLHLCPSLPQPPSLRNKETTTCSPFCPLWKGKRKSQHNETQHGNFKRFNFSAHGPAMDECQTAPLPDKRIQQSWRFPQGKSYHFIILACLHCPASHNCRSSCSHLKGSTALLHTENTHYHQTGTELNKLQTPALNQASSPSTVNGERQTHLQSDNSPI